MTELTHWGIKGQKWGVRRYQNIDGSFTQAGKERYKAAKSELRDTKRNPNSSRTEVIAAKSKVKKAKDLYKRAKQADKGKELYKQGKLITDNEDAIAARKRLNKKIANVSSVTIGVASSPIGRQYLSKRTKLGKYDVPMWQVVDAVAAGTALLSQVRTSTLNKIDKNENKNMRSYYFREKDVKDLVKKK